MLGWDVGGANIKAVIADAADFRVRSRPYALWENPAGLPNLLSAMATELATEQPGSDEELGTPDLVGVTLTAELADCFRTKGEGVAFVLRAIAAACPGARLRVLTSDGTFCSPGAAASAPLRVASANWAAAARLVAKRWPDAFLIDVGTTTTDIVPIVGGRVVSLGRTDLERLRAGELVYTGAVRTPLCAVARCVPLRAAPCRLAAERFAQSGDVHLLLGRLAPDEYAGATPDGRGKTRSEAAARLARMVCADLSQLTMEELISIAAYLARRQERDIALAVRQLRARLRSPEPRIAVTAGLGAFLARAAAARAGLETVDLAGELGEDGSRAAPAVAIALLLAAESA
ncbi:MAG: hydantoinase/oxoprolinase family protein [Gemmatimonadota bacterium]